LPKELVENNPDDSPKPPPPPLCLIKTEADGSETDRYRHIEQLAADAGSERMGAGGRQWSGSLRAQPDAPGVIIKVHGRGAGSGQHLIAKTDFEPITAISDLAGELDWQDMIITVMFEMDSYAEERYPQDADVPGTIESPRRVYVDLGDRARMDWAHKGAVRKVVDGVLQYAEGSSPSSDGEWLRNDSEPLYDMARFVYEWYGTQRQAFTLILKQLSGILEVGELLTSIGANETQEAANACVTSVEMDLLANTTRITTQFAELDPIQFI